mmetsp:Transcript_43332/g.70853  ORF Transcript_43332/g.70853 Transcript_43332/m.70853 type:complete len:95 (+) Transcript_43332:139-423(+)
MTAAAAIMSSMSLIISCYSVCRQFQGDWRNSDEEQYLLLLFLIFLVKAIAGSTNNNSSTEEGISINSEETKSPAAFNFLLRLKTYTYIYICVYI